MRPKVVIAVLVLAVVLMGVMALVSTVLRQEPALPSAGSGDFSQARSAPRSGSQDQKPNNSRFAKVDPVEKIGSRGLEPANSIAPNKISDKAIVNSRSSAASQNANHAEYVSQRIAELNDLAMNDDSNSLNTILAELSNPDKQIRKGALDAVIQFGDRSAIPTLQGLSAQTKDPAEKADILAAIDFLNLPSVFDVTASPKAASGTTGQTYLPRGNGFGGAPRSRGQSTMQQQSTQ